MFFRRSEYLMGMPGEASAPKAPSRLPPGCHGKVEEIARNEDTTLPNSRAARMTGRLRCSPAKGKSGRGLATDRLLWVRG